MERGWMNKDGGDCQIKVIGGGEERCLPVR